MALLLLATYQMYQCNGGTTAKTLRCKDSRSDIAHSQRVRAFLRIIKKQVCSAYMCGTRVILVIVVRQVGSQTDISHNREYWKTFEDAF